MPHCHCLIPDASGRRVLVVSTGEGRWSLPAFEHTDLWFAYALPVLARHASERFGAPMTALREHRVDGFQVCELEIQAEKWTPPAGAHWIENKDLAATVLESAELPDVLRAWFAEQAGVIPTLPPPWEKRGWYAEAAGWILWQCARLGYVASGPVEQVKAAWSWSSILRISTSDGALYFKADYAKPPAEPVIIEALARRWPRNVPSVVAADHERGWMLMRDFGKASLEGEPLARWQAATRTFSEIQVACSQDLEPWWRLNCPDLRIPQLVAHMDRLLGDDAALRIGEPGGLTDAAAARLRELMPRLHDMWDDLAVIPIPPSLVQQDFRHVNLVLSGHTCLFYDWSDTVVGHPFFACCRFLDDVPDEPGMSLDERRRRIAEAYLQPWKRFLGQADLWRAFELTRRLNPLYLAIRWYLDAPYCEPGSSRGREIRERPARALNRFLAGLHEPA